MRRVALLALFLSAVLLSISPRAQTAAPADRSAWSANLSDIRRMATLIPGRKPLRINVLKFAESHRTKNFSVKGEPATPSVQARTVFQVVYPDGYVMVDAGMDEPMPKKIGRGGEKPILSKNGGRV